MSTDKTRLAQLTFRKLSESKAKVRLKLIQSFLPINISPKHVYSIDFMNRDLIFVLNREFTKSLFTQITTKKGILGLILEYNDEGNTYYADKIILSNPKSGKEVLFEITNLIGDVLYDGIGKIDDATINFRIKGKPIEGNVRSTISGTITNANIKFKKSTMPNKISNFFEPKLLKSFTMN